jgi:hypothetical protein
MAAIRIVTILLLASMLVPCFAEARGGGGGHSSGGYGTGSSSSSHSVSSYTKRDGTYVAPSHATNPNGTQSDNFSAKGNVNPYTGKIGTKAATH